MKQFLIAFFLAVLPLAAPAQDARFDQAVALWLDGNDRESLPILSELANSDHTLARLLLARIETTDRGLSPYRIKLGPNAARALFRQDAGYGGFAKSWLTIEAAAGNETAIALLASRQPRPDASLISTLRHLGEAEAADYPTRILALYGAQADRHAMLKNPDLPEALRPYLQYLTDTPEPRGDGLAALRHITPYAAADIRSDDPDAIGIAGILALGYPYGDMQPDNRWRGVVEDWLLDQTP